MQLLLAESRILRFTSFALFYMAQGLPIGLITIALPAYMAAEGVPAASVANFIAVTGLPWAFKLLAGPVMDRFSFLSMGRRRPWVLLAQCGLLVSALALVLLPDPLTNLAALTTICFFLNASAAIQDVAVDGMAIDLTPVDERGRANAFMAFGQVSGYSGSAAVSAAAIYGFGVPGAAALLAFGVLVILLFALVVRERRGERLLPWTPGGASATAIALQVDRWSDIFRSLARVLFLPTSLVLIAVTLAWRMSGGFWLSVAPVVATQELGYSSQAYSSWIATAGFVSALLGLLIGPLIDRRGSERILLIALCGYGMVFVAAALYSDSWDEPRIALAIVFGEALFGQIIFIAFIAIHMNLCWRRVSATQFAVYMAWANLSRSIGAALYGRIEPLVDYEQTLLIMAGMSFVAAALITAVRLASHEARLARLEATVV